jgi:hypothetical protein
LLSIAQRKGRSERRQLHAAAEHDDEERIAVQQPDMARNKAPAVREQDRARKVAPAVREQDRAHELNKKKAPAEKCSLREQDVLAKKQAKKKRRKKKR